MKTLKESAPSIYVVAEMGVILASQRPSKPSVASSGPLHPLIFMGSVEPLRRSLGICFVFIPFTSICLLGTSLKNSRLHVDFHDCDLRRVYLQLHVCDG